MNKMMQEGGGVDGDESLSLDNYSNLYSAIAHISSICSTSGMLCMFEEAFSSCDENRNPLQAQIYKVALDLHAVIHVTLWHPYTHLLKSFMPFLSILTVTVSSQAILLFCLAFSINDRVPDQFLRQYLIHKILSCVCMCVCDVVKFRQKKRRVKTVDHWLYLCKIKLSSV